MSGHMNEQEVRTRAGWIGVEISRSRVRTPGRTGYGMYRVRTAAERHWHVPHPVVVPAGEWTAYAFTLEEIDTEISVAIGAGTPSGPAHLALRRSVPVGGGAVDLDRFVLVTVATRWTHRYRGRRDLGVGEDSVPGPVQVRLEFAEEVKALAAMVDAGLVVMSHAGGCACDGTRRMTAQCVKQTMDVEQCSGTVRERRREFNREFQAAHQVAREHGLRQRHAAKEARGQGGRSNPIDPPAARI